MAGDGRSRHGVVALFALLFLCVAIVVGTAAGASGQAPGWTTSSGDWTQTSIEGVSDGPIDDGSGVADECQSASNTRQANRESRNESEAGGEPHGDSDECGRPLFLNVGPFDPVTGEPDVSDRLLTTPDGLTAAGTSTTGYYVVQFDDATDEKLASLDGTIHSFVPDDGVLLESSLSLAEIRDRSFVRAALLYQPAYRLSGDLLADIEADNLDDSSERVDLQVWVFENRDAVARHVESLGGDARATSERHLRVNISETMAHKIAFLHEVRHVRRMPVYRPENNRARVVMGVADPETPTQNRFGLTGAGQIVGIADTGLDTGNPNTIHPDFRGRIVELFDLSGTGPNDTTGHGTHVAGSVLGNGSAANAAIGTPRPRGVAYEADLVFQATNNETKRGLSIPDNPSDLFTQARNEGARIHSNSWGAETHNWTYNKDAEQIDTFVRNHPDAIVLFSAGNAGTDWNRDGIVDAESVGPKKTAKNIITVGASENNRSALQFNADFDYTTNGTNLIWDYNHNETYDPGELVNGTAPDPGTPLQNITREDPHGGGDGDGDWFDSVIIAGNDGYANTTANGDDVQVVANNSGPWPQFQPVVLPGANKNLNTSDNGDDQTWSLGDDNWNNTAEIDRDGPGDDANGDGNLTYDPEPFVDEDGPVTWGRFERDVFLSIDQSNLNVTNGSLGFPVNPIRDDHRADDPEGVTAFSSRGKFVSATTAHLHRVKPDVVAPGSWILSTRSSECVGHGFGPEVNATHAKCIGDSLPGLASAPGDGSLQPHYMYLSGTSMATPLTAGTVTLVRQSYNDSTSLRGIDIGPSAALVKATLINGATDMEGQYGGDNGAALATPNHHEGWGRVNLSNSVAPGGRFTALGFVDERDGVLTDDGDEVSYTDVRFSFNRPVDITLVWTDEPASAYTTGNQIVNDLDLTVTAPDGTEYRGNVFDSNGTSVPDPGSRGEANNVEKVVLPEPQDGRHEITVEAANISDASSGQPFALVASQLAGIDPINDSREIRRTLTFVEDTVFPRAIGQPNGTTVDVYVLDHGEITVSANRNGPPHALGPATVANATAPTDANGTINIESFGNGLESSSPPWDAEHAVWNAPSNYVYDDQRRLGNGRYDLLVDVGRDAHFNRSADLLSRHDEPGFRVAAASAADANASVRGTIGGNESVFLTAAGLPAGRSLSAYVVPFDSDRDWENEHGLSLPGVAANVSGHPTAVTTDANGTVDHALVWDGPTAEEVTEEGPRFALAIDVNDDGEFDAGVDVVDVVTVDTLGTAVPLAIGASGRAVVELKAFLNKYAGADLDLRDDEFGTATEQAVIDYTEQQPDLERSLSVGSTEYDAIRADARTSFRFRPPDVTFSNLTAAPKRVVVGQNVTVTAVVTEHDGNLGPYNTTLRTDGTNETTRTNAIGPNEVTTVSFNTSFADTGNHTVAIEGLPPVTIEVFEPVPEDGRISESGTYLQRADFASEVVIEEDGVTYEAGGHTVGSIRVESPGGLTDVTVREVVATPGSNCVEQPGAPLHACEAGVRYDDVVGGTIQDVTVRGDTSETTLGIDLVDQTEGVTVTDSRLLGNGSDDDRDAIGIDLASNTTVTETTIEGYRTGIYGALGTTDNVIENTTVDLAGVESGSVLPTGIRIGSSGNTASNSSSTVVGNEVTHAVEGIRVGSDNTLRDNHAVENGVGIVSHGHGNVLADNNASANAGTGGSTCETTTASVGGIDILGNDTRVTNNTVTANGGSGILLAIGTSNNTVGNNTASGNGETGIYGCGFLGNTFTNNTVSSNGAEPFGPEAGLVLASNHDTLVTGTRATHNSGDGIRNQGLFESTNITVRNTTLSNNSGDGIELGNTTDSTVTATDSSGNADAGIRIDSSRNTTVRDNDITDNDGGVLVTFPSQNNTFRNNTIRNNTAAGIRFEWRSYPLPTSDNTVIDSEISNNGEGIVVEGANATTIRDNEVVHNDGHGVFLNTSMFGSLTLSPDNSTVTGNNVSDNDVGVRLVGTSNSTLRDNEVIANDNHGMVLTFSPVGDVVDSDNNTIADNRVTDNDGDGIRVNSASESTIRDNTVSDNGKGINFVGTGQENAVTTNLIENSSDDGLVFATVSGTLADNTVRHSGGTGITLWRSASANEVARNLVENNSAGIHVTGASNSNELTNDTVIDNDGAAVRIDGFSSDNELVDAVLSNNDAGFVSERAFDNRILTTRFNDTEVDVVHEGDIRINWSTAPAPDPPDAENISRFLAVTNDTAAWANVTVHYTDADVENANESRLGLWRYNGSGWAKTDDTGVDTAANEVFGNLTSFSVVAPLWEYPTAPFVVVDPLTHDYGGVRINETASQTVTIDNVGQAPLEVGTPTLAGNASFSIASAGPPTVVPGGDTTTVVVEFSPVETGTQSATLTVPTNDTDETVSLSGTGVANALPVPAFDWEPDEPLVDETVTFNATDSFDPDGTVTGSAWDLTDNGTVDATGPVANWSYASAGNETVTLAITDDFGDRNVTSRNLTVSTPSVAHYADENGTVRTPGLFDAIDHWRSDVIKTTLLLDVISAWRSTDPVT